MNKFTAIVFCGSFVAMTGCNGDDGDGDLEKGVVDIETLEESGGDVTLSASGRTGKVTVPFEVAVPETDDEDEDLEDQLSDAVELVVQSKTSGVSAAIGGGELVDGVPESPGEFSWEINEDRDEAELTFYNETVDGYTLKTTVEYEATLTVHENDYVDDFDTIVFDVNPTN